MARSPGAKPAARRVRKRPEAGFYPEPSPPPKRRRKVSLPAVESYSTRIRTLILNLAFVSAFLVFLPVLASQFLRNEVLIDQITVPRAMEALGLTPEVAASRLWDGIGDATARARTSKAGISALPDSRRVKFTVPNSGVSMDQLVRQTRAFFNAYETRILGEFTCSDPACDPKGFRLRLRVLRGTSKVIDMPPIGDTPIRDYFTDAAVALLSELDPFIAISAVAEKEPVRAIALARALIRQNHPDAKWAHNLVGNIRSMREQYGLALPEYRAALRIDPDFAIAVGNLASTLRRLGDPAAAREEFDRLARLDPGNPKIYEGYGDLADGAGRPDEAIAMFRNAMAIDPKSPIYPWRIGEIEEARGHADEAHAAYAASLAIDPGFQRAFEAMFILEAGAGNLAALETLSRNATSAAPDDAELAGFHSLALGLLNRPEEAAKAAERAVALAPDDLDILKQAINAYKAVDRLPEALALAQHAATLDPYDPQVIFNIASAQMLLQHKQEAMAAYRRVLELDTTGMQYGSLAQGFLDILEKLP